MAVLLDLQCSRCGEILTDQWSTRQGGRHCAGGRLEWLPSKTRTGSPYCSEREKAVVFVSEKEGGKIAYPARNDSAIPKHLRGRGYERVQVTPDQMGAFEKKHKVISQIRHFDRNGRGLEDNG